MPQTACCSRVVPSTTVNLVIAHWPIMPTRSPLEEYGRPCHHLCRHQGTTGGAIASGTILRYMDGLLLPHEHSTTLTVLVSTARLLGASHTRVQGVQRSAVLVRRY
jgi:hypothetical protein